MVVIERYIRDTERRPLAGISVKAYQSKNQCSLRYMLGLGACLTVAMSISLYLHNPISLGFIETPTCHLSCNTR
jgi:hypothetical protein